MGPLLRTPGAGRRHDGLAGRRPDARSTSSGRLVLDRRPRPFDRIPSTRVSPADRRRLWDAVVRLAGIADPRPAPTLIGERMTRIHERLTTDLPIETTFDFIANFANAARLGSRHRVVAADRGERWAHRGRHDLRARRPDGRPGRPDDLPDHATSSGRHGSSSSAKGSGVDVGRRHPLRAERGTGPPSTTRPTSRSGASGRLAQPFLGGTFERIGRDAAAGMRDALAALAASGDDRRPDADAGRDHRGRDQRPQRRLRAAPRPRHRALRRRVADRRPRQDRRGRDRRRARSRSTWASSSTTTSPTRRSCACSASSASRPSRAT